MKLNKIENRVIETYKFDDYIIEITAETACNGDIYYNGYIYEEDVDFREHITGVMDKDFLIEYINNNIFRIIADYIDELDAYEEFCEQRIDEIVEGKR